jgi:hypothetical protein
MAAALGGTVIAGIQSFTYHLRPSRFIGADDKASCIRHFYLL